MGSLDLYSDQAGTGGSWGSVPTGANEAYRLQSVSRGQGGVSTKALLPFPVRAVYEFTSCGELDLPASPSRNKVFSLLHRHQVEKWTSTPPGGKEAPKPLSGLVVSEEARSLNKNQSLIT